MRPQKNWIRDGKVTIDSSRTAPKFIRQHRLWEGFRSYKWFVKGMIIIAIILGLDFITSIPDLFSGDDQDAQNNGLGLFGTLTSNALNVDSYMNGSFKYLILIGIEIIIFHFTRRAMMVVTGDHIPTDFNTFIGAEKRMIKVAIFSFFMETLFRFLFNTTLSFFGVSGLEMIVLFGIQSYYLGFAIVDNYNELFDMTIKQSHRYTWQYAPVALITGAIINVMMKIPIIGVIAGPVICAVIATLTMHHLANLELDRSWVYVEKDKKKKPRRAKKL